MMAQGPRVVAELGRPETPDETAARKSESSRVYRSSQTFRNLIAALIATLVVVVVAVVLVPRGELAPRKPIDVAAIAAEVSASEGRTALTPKVPSEWRVNVAELRDRDVRAWTISYVPGEGAGFLSIAQGFDADAAWPTRMLSGAGPKSTVTVDGIVWDRYEIPDPSRARNIATALSTTAGPDTVLIYGASADANFETAAAAVADDVRRLRGEGGE